MDGRVQCHLREINSVHIVSWSDSAVDPHVSLETEYLLLLYFSNLLQVLKTLFENVLIGLQRLVVLLPPHVFVAPPLKVQQHAPLRSQLLTKTRLVFLFRLVPAIRNAAQIEIEVGLRKLSNLLLILRIGLVLLWLVIFN